MKFHLTKRIKLTIILTLIIQFCLLLVCKMLLIVANYIPNMQDIKKVILFIFNIHGLKKNTVKYKNVCSNFDIYIVAITVSIYTAVHEYWD